MAFDDDEKRTLWIVICVGASVSLLGSLFIMTMYAIFPTLRGYSFRLIFYLSLADFFTSIMFIIPESAFSEWCKMKGGLINLTSLWRILLTAVIANSIYISYRDKDIDFRKREKYFMIGIAIISVVLSMLPYSTRSYGHAQGICWIVAEGDSLVTGTIWRVVIYYGPFWSVFIYNTVVYASIVKSVRQELKVVEGEDVYVDTIIKKLRMYPAVLMVCMVPTSLNRFYDTIWPDDPSIVLTCMAFGILSSMGLFNAIVYGCTPSVKISIMSAFSQSSSYTEYEVDANHDSMRSNLV